jgi:hypothetical protein
MEKHMKRFCAEFIQSGTNERMTVNADTLEELDTLLYGRPYPAKRSSVKIYERSAAARRVDFNTKVALGSAKKHQQNMKVTLDRAPWEEGK